MTSISVLHSSVWTFYTYIHIQIPTHTYILV